MNYLLDTHVLLWVLIDPGKLSKRAGEVLTDNAALINVSSLSFWEIALKFGLGKLELHRVEPDELPEITASLGFHILAPEASEMASFHKLRAGKHRDPFDRMLIWQAINHRYVLISKDKSLREYRKNGLKVLW